MIEKIKVNVAVQKNFDIGLFSDEYADGSILLNKDVWEKYIKVRLEFEQIHESILGAKKKYWLQKYKLEKVKS